MGQRGLTAFATRGYAAVLAAAVAACGGKTLDAPRDAGADTPPDAPHSPTPTSCEEARAGGMATKSGVYSLRWDTKVVTAYCDLDVPGVALTAFFSGKSGSSNVFAHFEQDADDCPDPASQCLRRVPPQVSTARLFAARCGGDVVTFHLDQAALSYFQRGEQAKWRPLTDVSAVAGSPDLGFAAEVWTGEGTNEGWILSANDNEPSYTPHTFASSYDWNDTWNYCNGTQAEGSPVRLYFR